MRAYFVVVAVAFGASAASASITPVLKIGSPTVSGSSFAYSYKATLSSAASLQTGNYFTIYDFGDFVSVSAAPTNWSFSTANLGVTPTTVLPGDEASIINITFTYNGPTLNYDINAANNTDLTFSPFTILSRSGVALLDSYTSQTVNNGGLGRGTLIDSVGKVQVPLVNGGSGSFVPEPANWAMLIAGFGLTGAKLRRRRSGVVAF